jgi:Ala-tRNA(Pro) deacylase
MSLLNRLLHQDETHLVPVETYLRENQVPFSVHHHPPAYSAQHLAHAEHVPGRMVAKVVIAFADDQMVMLCLQAPCRVNVLRLMDLMGTANVRIAREDEFANAFPDCELGAMPPFGNLYRMPVYVDKGLAEDDRIIFQAGTHTDTCEMAYQDFARLVHPVVADFCSAP